MNLRRKNWWLGSLLLLGLAGVVLWLCFKPRPGRFVRLPDGREWRVKSVTYGTEHLYVHGMPWLKPFVRILPETWTQRWGVRKLRHRTDGPALVVWVHMSGRSSDPYQTSEAAVFDERGVESEPQPYKPSAILGSWSGLYAWAFASFPRRGRTIGLRLYRRDNAYRPQPMAEFTLPNPVRGRYPLWPDGALPATNRQNSLQFILDRLTTGEPVAERQKASRGYVAPWNTAIFRVAQDGRPTDAWGVVGLEVSDATGNRTVPTYTHITNAHGAIRFGFSSPFWAGEGACKLLVEFVRVAEYEPADRWTLTNLMVPAADARNVVGVRTNLQGVMLAVQQLDRAVARGPLSSGQMRPDAEIVCQLIPPTRGIRLSLAGVHDDKRRLLRHATRGYLTPTGQEKFAIELLPDSDALDLTFVVQRSRFVEFVVKPQPYSTNNASWRSQATKMVR